MTCVLDPIAGEVILRLAHDRLDRIQSRIQVKDGGIDAHWRESHLGISRHHQIQLSGNPLERCQSGF